MILSSLSAKRNAIKSDAEDNQPSPAKNDNQQKAKNHILIVLIVYKFLVWKRIDRTTKNKLILRIFLWFFYVKQQQKKSKLF